MRKTLNHRVMKIEEKTNSNNKLWVTAINGVICSPEHLKDTNVNKLNEEKYSIWNIFTIKS